MNYNGKLMESKYTRKQVQWISGRMKQNLADDGKFQIQVGLHYMEKGSFLHAQAPMCAIILIAVN